MRVPGGKERGTSRCIFELKMAPNFKIFIRNICTSKKPINFQVGKTEKYLYAKTSWSNCWKLKKKKEDLKGTKGGNNLCKNGPQ